MYNPFILPRSHCACICNRVQCFHVLTRRVSCPNATSVATPDIPMLERGNSIHATLCAAKPESAVPSSSPPGRLLRLPNADQVGARGRRKRANGRDMCITHSCTRHQTTCFAVHSLEKCSEVRPVEHQYSCIQATCNGNHPRSSSLIESSGQSRH